MSVGKEMLMVKHLWGVSPISPSPLWALGPSLALGQFQGAQGGLSVCLSVHPWGGQAEQGADALQQHLEGAHSQSVFSCWEKRL